MTAAARPPARPETSLRQQVRTLFLVTLALAIAAMSLSVYSLVRLLDRRHTLVSVVQPAALDTGRLLTALVDEETGIRGFLLTTSPDFLEPYRTGQADEGVALAGIDRAARRRPAVAASAAAVRASVQAWHDQYADPTVAATQAGDTTGRSPASLDQGRVLFDQIRLDVAQLLADLDHQRAAAQEALDHATVVLAVSVGLLSVVTMVGGALVWRLYRRSIETPLLAVAADAAMVSAGQLDTPIVPTGPAELVAMAASMETMRARIVAELAEANQARAEVEEQRAALERSNRDLEQFAYVASHDLQEPLRKVASFTQLLQSRYHDQLDERADQYIDYAVDGAKRMQVLINDLLAFSRVTRQTDHAGPVDSGAACAAAIDHLATLIEESGAEVNAGPLPVVVGNAGLLVALFQNLVGNAVKFRSPDRPPVVSVDAEPDGDRWRFTVADNGVGIEPEYAERVFEIFKRLHTRDAYPGTGIGLALCRKIVDALGGEIWVDTAATEGARIRFTLRRPEEHPRMNFEKAKVAEILLVEDDPGDVLITQEALAQSKLVNNLYVVSDGDEALEFLQQRGRHTDAVRPDLVLLDLNLPRRDGREVLDEIKRSPDLRRIPVVVLTTSRAEEDVLRSYDLHANAYVNKPVDFDQFVRVVRQIDDFFFTVVRLSPS